MATNINFPTYGFVNKILALSEGNWRTFFKPFITDSVQNGLATIEGANMTVYVSAGECRCGAVMGILDEMIALDIANGDSTYDRIDSVVVQYTYGEPSTLAVAIVQGIPSANPVPPTLTKAYDTLWQMEIAQILVPSGATSANEFTITDKRVIYESIESIIDDNTESEERVWSSQKTHEEIVSLSTEIYDNLNTKADAIERTVSGDIVTITDGGDNIPVKELVVGIEPVQDLHGYDNPWPAGGGMNIMPKITPGTYSNKGYTAVVSEDGVITISGTRTESGAVNISFPISVDEFVVPLNYSLHARNSYGNSKITLFIGGMSPNLSTVNRIFTNSSERQPSSTCTLRFGEDITGELAFTMQPSIEATDSITDWTPFTNICPISGWDEATVTRTGANLLNLSDKRVGKYISNSAVVGSTISLNNSNSFDVYAKVAYVTAGNTYVFSYNKGDQYLDSSRSGAICDDNDVMLETGFITWNRLTSSVQITPSVSGWLWISVDNKSSDFRLNIPSDISTVTISLGATRYGGTLDVTTGMLTVTHRYVDLGTLTWANNTGSQYIVEHTFRSLQYYSVNGTLLQSICSKYPVYNSTNIIEHDFGIALATPGSKIYVMDINRPDISQVPEFLSGVQLVYKLATPQTVDLNDQHALSTIIGENHIFADTGDTSVTYRADTKLFIEESLQSQSNALKLMLTPNVETEMVASQNYALGSIVIVNNDFLKLTSAVASGANLVIGSNCVKTTMAEWVASLTA